MSAITSHPDLVRHIANQLQSRLPAGLQREDLERHGRHALDAALAEYDGAHPGDLETFTSNRVRRAMLDAMSAPERGFLARRFRSLLKFKAVST